jgi:serine/threonine-protein kinase
VSAHDALRARTGRDWPRLEALVDEALDAPAAEREALIAARCGDEAALREAALTWLRACDEDDAADPTPGAAAVWAALHGATHDGPADDALEGPDDAPHAVQPAGHLVGAWRILRPLGRGGMGAVYLAERADVELPQRAALKFMHGAVALDAVGVRRFRDERRILAALDHPAIARLLDGGVAGGLPWFAMEFVDGAPVDAWCDARALPVEARLRLFGRVCDAVQHAHARLVVHRDLKPANILVGPDGEPKLLDFGIAKLLDSEASSDAALTRPEAQPLTPAYAAPEQRRGAPPSTVMDVHALGVLLHVLLVGTLPTAGGTATASGRPSLAARRGADAGPRAGARGTTPARLARRLRGDLDVIVARAMHADPTRRYPSADALAADVRRHLDARPVLARADGMAYRLRKLVARHPAGSATATAAALLVMGFATVAVQQAIRLRAQAAVLVAERDKANEVTAFLTGILVSADPYQDGGRVPTLREVLDRGAARAASTLHDRPLVRAHLLSAMAPAYFGLGDRERAGALADEAVALRRRALPPDHPELAASLIYLANVRLNQARAPEAVAHAREALAIRRRLPPSEDTDTLRALGVLGAALQRAGRLPEAESVLRALLAAERGRTPVVPRQVVQVARNLAHVLRDGGRAREAIPLYTEAYAGHRAVFGDEHPESANSAVNLGRAHLLAGDAATAEPLLRHGVTVKRRLLGMGHLDVRDDARTHAQALDALGRRAEAAALRREIAGAEAAAGRRTGGR